jgi:hypothetical protein
MKMLTEYLERALEFEALADREEDEAFKAELQKQAAAYRKLAESAPSNMAFPGRARQMDKLFPHISTAPRDSLT